jgi:uncharacterized membrane protein
MDIVMVVLRLFHLFSSVIWAGFTFAMVLLVAPAFAPLGPEGGKMMLRISGTRNFQIVIPSAAGLSVLSGLLLYYRLFGPMAPLNTGAGLALTVGGAAGVLAFIEGLQINRTQNALREASNVAEKTKPSESQNAEMQKLQQKLGKLTATTAILMVIALTGMTLSEYFAI